MSSPAVDHCQRRRQIIQTLFSSSSVKTDDDKADGRSFQPNPSSSNNNVDTLNPVFCSLCHHTLTPILRTAEEERMLATIGSFLEQVGLLNFLLDRTFCSVCLTSLQTLVEVKVALDELGDRLCVMMMGLHSLFSKSKSRIGGKSRREEIQAIFSSSVPVQQSEEPIIASPIIITSNFSCPLCHEAIPGPYPGSEEVRQTVKALMGHVGLTLTTAYLDVCHFCSSQLQSLVDLKGTMDGLGERLCAMLMGLRNLLVSEVQKSVQGGEMSRPYDDENETEGLSKKPEQELRLQEEPQTSVPSAVYPRPTGLSNNCLIALALKNSKTGALPASEIYKFVCDHFPHFKTAVWSWKQSLRSNLSQNKDFGKKENSFQPVISGSRERLLWFVNPDKMTEYDTMIQNQIRRDPMAVKRAMRHPENLELLERGELVRDYSDDGGCSNDQRATAEAKGPPMTTCSTPTQDVAPATYYLIRTYSLTQPYACMVRVPKKAP